MAPRQNCDGLSHFCIFQVVTEIIPYHTLCSQEKWIRKSLQSFRPIPKGSLVYESFDSWWCRRAECLIVLLLHRWRRNVVQIWNSIPNLHKSIFYLILTNLNVEKIEFVPFNVPTADFHGQFTAIHVHKRKRIGSPCHLLATHADYNNSLMCVAAQWHSCSCASCRSS